MWMKIKSILLCFKEEATCSEQSEKEVHHESQELPHDVITRHILTRLPIKSVLRFKPVSKQWYSTLSSYQFGDAHFKFYSLINASTPNHYVLVQKCPSFFIFVCNENGGRPLFRLQHDFGESACYSEGKLGCIVKGDELRLIGSCNGLVCIGSLYDFILWNPVIRRFKKFDSDRDSRLYLGTPSQVSWGFGYVSSTDDYKVVRIIELPLTVEIMVHVFSMKYNSWRRIHPREYDHILSLRSFKSAVIICDQEYIFHTNRGVVCDERIYWIVAKADVWGRRVVSFDLVDETFVTDHNVDVVSREVYSDEFVCVMRGCLSIYGANMRGDAYISTYDRPREGLQEKDSIRLFRDLSLASCTDLVDLSRDGKFLVQKGNAEIGVVDSSLKPMTYKRLMRFDVMGGLNITRHVPSLLVPEFEDSKGKVF